jgi:hypothetical protein
VTLIRVAVGIDHRNLDAVDQANRLGPHLAILVTIVDPLHGWSIENARRVPKGDSMPADIGDVLRWIPGESHPGPLRKVFTHVEM